MTLQRADHTPADARQSADPFRRAFTLEEIQRIVLDMLRSNTCTLLRGASPDAGILLDVPEPFDAGGPFYPTVGLRQSSAPVEEAIILDDQIQVGGTALKVSGTTYSGVFPGRSATTPAVLSLDGFVKTIDTADTVNLWKSSAAGDTLTGNRETRLLCLRAWLSPAPGLTPPIEVDHDYTFIATDTLTTVLSSWCDEDGKQYFPLGWVTIYKDFVDVAGVARDHNFRVASIIWPNTAWMLQSQWMLPVEITESFSTYCLGKIYARDMTTVVASGQTIKFWPLPTGYNVPVGGKFFAQRMGSWFLAQNPILF